MSNLTVDRLTTLRDFLKTLGTDQLDMDRWMHQCGTVACALGWACTIPEFKAAGLYIEEVHPGKFLPVFEPGNIRSGERYSGYDAAKAFFELEREEVWRLFNPDRYVGGSQEEDDGTALIVTVSQVIERLDFYIAKYAEAA